MVHLLHRLYGVDAPERPYPNLNIVAYDNSDVLSKQQSRHRPTDAISANKEQRKKLNESFLTFLRSRCSSVMWLPLTGAVSGERAVYNSCQ